MKIQSVNIRNFKGLEDIQINELQTVNAFLGKNNSGKSSILHAIDIASLAMSQGGWDAFQPKLQIKDLINNVGGFEISTTYDNGTTVTVNTNDAYSPTFDGLNDKNIIPKSILILPDVGIGLATRQHRTPKWIYNQIQNKNFNNVNSLEILYAIKFYAERNEKELTIENYNSIVSEISNYFPDISNITSSVTDEHVPTLTYHEYERDLDILYSGTGLKHFLDILVKVTLSGASIVLLDEPELGLHPDLQRRFFEYLQRLAEEKDLQIFLGTHSQVILNYTEFINFFRIKNDSGNRTINHVASEAIQTVLSDLGIRPSDVFNQDICLMVEGASEIIFFEHVIRELYSDEFEKIGFGIIQYGGGAADGIIKGSISVSNIVPAQSYIYWIRDRDAQPDANPSTSSNQFKRKIEEDGYECHIWNKREIEYYYPRELLVAAQQGDAEKETQVLQILDGDQSQKFRNAASENELCVPEGKYLRRLLKDHLTDVEMLDQEIKDIIENTLSIWKNEILGEE